MCEANPRKRVTIIRFNCCLVKFTAKILKFTGFNQNLLLSNTLRTNRFSKTTFTVPKNSPKVAKLHSKFLVPVWFVDNFFSFKAWMSVPLFKSSIIYRIQFSFLAFNSREGTENHLENYKTRGQTELELCKQKRKNIFLKAHFE